MIKDKIVITSSIDQFRKSITSEKMPMVFRDDYNKVARKKWTLDYLKKVFKNKKVRLDYYKYKAGQQAWEGQEFLFPEAINRIINNKDPDIKYHLMQKSVLEDFPELMDDIETPNFLNKQVQYLINLWIGESGTISPAHYDFSDNFLTQILGKKRARLFSPEESSNLYPYPIDSLYLEKQSAAHISQIQNTDSLDITNYPKLKHLHCYEAMLEPGDVLYIPCGWWHEIKAMDTSISVNYWWKVNLFDLSGYQLTNWLCSTYFNFNNSDLDTVIEKYFDMPAIEFISLAEVAMSKQLNCVAAVLLLFVFEQIKDEIKPSETLFSESITLQLEHLQRAKQGDDSLIDASSLSSFLSSLKSWVKRPINT